MVDRLVSVPNDSGQLPDIVLSYLDDRLGNKDSVSAAKYATLQEAATAAAGKRLIIPAGTYPITSTVTIPDDTHVTAPGATLQVTSANVVAVSLGSRSSLTGLSVQGFANDYVAGGSPVAVGIEIASKTNVKVVDCRITNVSGASIRLRASKSVTIDKCVISGVGASKITSNDGGSCWGIYLDSITTTHTSDVTITNCDISNACQGIIGSINTTNLTIALNSVHDIQGQHAMYLQNGTGVRVVANKIDTTNYNGIKVQLASNSVADSSGCTIADNVVANTGDNGLILYSTDTNLVYKMRNVTITANTLDNCTRGIFIGSLRGFTVTGNVVRASGQHGIQMQDCQDGELNLGSILESGRIGFLLSAIANGSNARVHVRGGQIRNPGAANFLNATYGIQFSDGTDITFDGVDISSSNSNMDRGILVGSTADQATSAWRSMTVAGATAAAIQFRSGPLAVKEFTGNRFPTISNAPTSLTTTVAPAAGGAAALPATPLGYATLLIGGVERRVPFYAMS